MKRSLRFGMLLVAAITMVIAVSSRAAAQAPIPNTCCQYCIDVAGFPAACFPIVLTTQWTGCVQTLTINNNTVGPVCFPITCLPCPPAPAQFFWGSLNGGITKAWFNFPAKFTVNGCCFMLRIGRNAAGCIVVTIRPC